MVKIILIKSPDEWATTKQVCRDELVVYLSATIYIYIYIYTYHIYVCMYICIFFFLFVELLSTLSGEKYIIAKVPLRQSNTNVGHI